MKECLNGSGRLESYSRNLMYANPSITDGIYAILSDANVRGSVKCHGHTKSMSSEG